MVLTDEEFFARFPARQTHIRPPTKVLARDSARRVAYVDECELEFRSLGDHKRERRRILVWRVPADNPFYDPIRQPLLKVPFLAFSDESIEDSDDVLLPILRTIMAEQLETVGRA